MSLKRYKILVFFKIFLTVIVIYFFIKNFFIEEKVIDNTARPNSVIFIVDVSKSMKKKDVENKYWLSISRFQLEKLFIQNFTNLINSWVLEGIVTFARFWKRYVVPTKDITILNLYLNKIDVTQFSQWSNIIEGLDKMVYYSCSGDVGIILSDFDFIYDKKKLNIILKKVRQKNIKLYFFKIWEGSLSNCKNLANSFGSQCIELTSYSEFKKLKLFESYYKKENQKIPLNEMIKVIILSLFSL